MKSQTNHTIVVKKCVNLGYFPLFVSMAQRHFEKSQPSGEKRGEATVFPCPVDMLRLSVTNEEVLKSVESIEFEYHAHRA